MEEPESSKSVLLVEDDADIVLGLRDAFEFEGYTVYEARTGQAGVDLAAEKKPSAIVLDLMLPDLNGYAVCEQIRKRDTLVPILMLTARSQESDKIRGLDAGADDYVTKPFSVGELIARVRAIFRRLDRSALAKQPTFTIGSATIKTDAHTLVKNGKEVQLSFYEVELLKLLHERVGQPVTRDEILDKIWGVEAYPTNRTVDNFIVKLRKKIEDKPDQPRHILTVYGTGYKLVAA